MKLNDIKVCVVITSFNVIRFHEFNKNHPLPNVRTQLILEQTELMNL
jgi:hypothetical protein